MPTPQDDFAAQLQQAVRQQWALMWTLRQLLGIYNGNGYATMAGSFTVISSTVVDHAVMALSALDTTAKGTISGTLTVQDYLSTLVP